MKRAAVAVRSALVWFAAQVGLEGAFLVIGTASLAVWSSYFGPQWPWAVVGVMAVLTALALTVPRRAA